MKIKKISTKGKEIQIKKEHSKTTKENSTYKLREMTRTHTNNRMQKKPNDSGLKHGNQENITKKLNG